MGPMWWQERTNSHRLCSDLHIHTKAGTHTCTHTHTQINARTNSSYLSDCLQLSVTSLSNAIILLFMVAVLGIKPRASHMTYH